jgi:hypothetical protein
VGWRRQLPNVLLRPVGASSPADFWRYWNPVYGYALYYWSYRPLRRVLPRPLAVWLTFVLCGFVLHDLVGWAASGQRRYPEMTVIFAVLGAGAVASDVAGIDLTNRPFLARAALNAAYLVASWVVAAQIISRSA